MTLAYVSQNEVVCKTKRGSYLLDNKEDLIRSESNLSPGGQHNHTQYTICSHPKYFFLPAESRGIYSSIDIDP
jgi:hypothetical protein